MTPQQHAKLAEHYRKRWHELRKTFVGAPHYQILDTLFMYMKFRAHENAGRVGRL